MIIKLPNEVEYILSKIESNNFQAYVVGGALRDTILNKTPSDFDIATNASIEQIQEIFKDEKIIETGLKHGTVTLRIHHQNYEITSFRGYDNNSLKEDLAKRDFTINALAYSLKDGLVDLFSCVDDIKNKTLRLVNENEQLILDDPLRILRGIRFIARYNLKITSQTKAIFNKHRKLLNNVSKERINVELNSILLSNSPSKIIEEYFEIFKVLVPPLKAMKGFKQNNPYHYLDVLEHTFKVLDNVPNDLSLRLAALFHDIGKPNTYQEKDGIDHFYGHYHESVIITLPILQELKYDNKTIDEVINLIEYHDLELSCAKTIKKLLNKIDVPLFMKLLDLKAADIKGQSPKYLNRLDDIEKIRNYVNEILKKNECFSLKDLAINGNDLIALGIPKSKKLGNMLNELLDLVIEKKLENGKDILINYVKENMLNK